MHPYGNKYNDAAASACPHQENQPIKMLAWKLPVTTLHCFACFPCSNLTDNSLPVPHKNGHIFQELKDDVFLIFLHFFFKSSDFIHGQGHYAKVCNYHHFSATSKYEWGTLLCHTCWSLLLLAMPGFPGIPAPVCWKKNYKRLFLAALIQAKFPMHLRRVSARSYNWSLKSG